MSSSSHAARCVFLRRIFFVLAIVAILPAAKADSSDPAILKKGEYLAIAGDCAACHTAPGGKPFAGGHYLESQFGGFFIPNITPDKKTGIGDWSDDDFYRALHEGIGRRGEFLYPAFPFPWYTKVTREDALAIKAYLFSLPPETTPPKPEKIHFPMNFREGLLAWRTLFFKPGEFKPDPSKSAEINRGAYLVEGLGHCGECHNRSNVLGASNWSGKLQGGVIEGWYAPNITLDGREGVGKWSIEQIATFLKTGASPGKGVALGPMSETIEHSLSHLSDEDVAAIAAYLKSVPAEETSKAANYEGFKGPDAAGGGAYLTHCASCHLPDGKGIVGEIPALQDNGAVLAKGPENIIRAVLGGMPTSNGLAPMPAVGAGMTDEEVVAAVDYVRQSWGNAAPVSEGPGTVAKLRAGTQTLLAANVPGGCPEASDARLAKAIEQSNAAAQLKAMRAAIDLNNIDLMLKDLRSKIAVSAPDAKDDDIVNALTAAYCPVATTGQSAQAAAAQLGDFSSLVYGQIKREGLKN